MIYCDCRKDIYRGSSQHDIKPIRPGMTLLRPIHTSPCVQNQTTQPARPACQPNAVRHRKCCRFQPCNSDYRCRRCNRHQARPASWKTIQRRNQNRTPCRANGRCRLYNNGSCCQNHRHPFPTMTPIKCRHCYGSAKQHATTRLNSLTTMTTTSTAPLNVRSNPVSLISQPNKNPHQSSVAKTTKTETTLEQMDGKPAFSIQKKIIKLKHSFQFCVSNQFFSWKVE